MTRSKRLQLLLLAALAAWPFLALLLYHAAPLEFSALGDLWERLTWAQPALVPAPGAQPKRFNIDAIVRANECTCGAEKIPRILHHIFLDGEEQYEKETRHEDPAFRWAHRESCIVHHPHWKHRFWDLETAEQFLAERYAWFLPTFRGYSRTVARSDALRIFLMHAFGGLYVDLDIECFRNGDDMLKGFDIVLQGTVPEEGVTNAVMASAPGHPVWVDAMHALVANAQWTDDHPINQTGPGVLANLLHPLIPNLPRGRGINFREHLVGVLPAGNDTYIKVYPLGKWMTPCWFIDKECHLRVARWRAEGVAPFDLVGYHRYSGSWNGYTGRWIQPKIADYFKGTAAQAGI